MKAVAVFPGTRRFGVISHDEPSLAAPTDVKLKMLEVGICGTDKEIVAFEYGTPPDGSEYLVIGHESLGEVVETGSRVAGLKPGDLAVPSVRRPCSHPECIACRAGRQDFCYTGDFTERGIKQAHGYMTELVVEDASYLNSVPRALREVAVLVEPLTIAEKAIAQLWQVQRRLPWATPLKPGEAPGHARRALVLGAGPVGLLGAMKLVLEGFQTTVYSRTREGDRVAELVGAIGANFIHAENTPVPDMASQIGNIDVVYEAVGASSLAFEVLPFLGTNGAFIFTGVPGRKGPIEVDTDSIMRDAVLRNQMIFGTVNAPIESFAQAISDLGEFYRRWPGPVKGIITNHIPIERAAEALAGRVPGIKNVISIS